MSRLGRFQPQQPTILTAPRSFDQGVFDRPGVVFAMGPTPVAVTLIDTPGAVWAFGPGGESVSAPQAVVAFPPAPIVVADLDGTYLAYARHRRVTRIVTPRAGVAVTLTDTPGAVLAGGGVEQLTSGVVVTDHPGAAYGSNPGQSLAIDRILADTPGAVLARGGTETVSAPPVTVQFPPAPMVVADLDGVYRAYRATYPTVRQPVAPPAAVPVTLTDRPGAVWASGPGQALTVDRILADTPGMAAAGRGPVEQISSTFPVNLPDRPGAVQAAAPGQILVVDIIRHDTPGVVFAFGPPAWVAYPVTLTDRPGAAAAYGTPTTVTLGDPLAGWPPIVTGPFRAPLFVVSGPKRG